MDSFASRFVPASHRKKRIGSEALLKPPQLSSEFLVDPRNHCLLFSAPRRLRQLLFGLSLPSLLKIGVPAGSMALHDDALHRGVIQGAPGVLDLAPRLRLASERLLEGAGQAPLELADAREVRRPT